MSRNNWNPLKLINVEQFALKQEDKSKRNLWYLESSLRRSRPIEADWFDSGVEVLWSEEITWVNPNEIVRFCEKLPNISVHLEWGTFLRDKINFTQHNWRSKFSV